MNARACLAGVNVSGLYFVCDKRRRHRGHHQHYISGTTVIWTDYATNAQIDDETTDVEWAAGSPESPQP